MIRDTSMGCAEREEHHEELVAEGFQWCPECGATLYCLPDHVRTTVARGGSPPIVTGDCPPLTGEDLRRHP